jgi:hypothetical protein
MALYMMFSPEIYHITLVKLNISDSKYLNLLLFLRGAIPSQKRPFLFSKFLDPPLTVKDKICQVRLGDFQVKPVYTLMVTSVALLTSWESNDFKLCIHIFPFCFL